MISHNEAESLKAQIICFRNEIVLFNEALSITRQNLKDLEMKCGEIEKVNSLYGKFDDVVKKVNNHVASNEARYIETKCSTDIHTSDISNIKNHLTGLNFNVECLVDSLSKFKKNNDDLHESSQCNVNNSINLFSQTINKNIEDLRMDLAISPKDVHSQNEELMKKLDNASADGTNAMLCVLKQANQIRILESKIVQISDQIKNIEISLEK